MAETSKNTRSGRGCADGCARVFLIAFFSFLLLFFVWGIVLTGGYGFFDRYQSFSHRTVQLIGQGKLCPGTDKDAPLSHRNVYGRFALDGSREVVSISYEDSVSVTKNYYIASEGKTVANKVCVKLQKLASEPSNIEYMDSWFVKWNDAWRSYMKKTGNPVVTGDAKTSFEIWKEFCTTKYAKKKSPDWCKQTGP